MPPRGPPTTAPAGCPSSIEGWLHILRAGPALQRCMQRCRVGATNFPNKNFAASSSRTRTITTQAPGCSPQTSTSSTAHWPSAPWAPSASGPAGARAPWTTTSTIGTRNQTPPASGKQQGLRTRSDCGPTQRAVRAGRPASHSKSSPSANSSRSRLRRQRQASLNRQNLPPQRSRRACSGRRPPWQNHSRPTPTSASSSTRWSPPH